jgi:hypothetical protein
MKKKDRDSILQDIADAMLLLKGSDESAARCAGTCIRLALTFCLRTGRSPSGVLRVVEFVLQEAVIKVARGGKDLFKVEL